MRSARTCLTATVALLMLAAALGVGAAYGDTLETLELATMLAQQDIEAAGTGLVSPAMPAPPPVEAVVPDVERLPAGAAQPADPMIGDALDDALDGGDMSGISDLDDSGDDGLRELSPSESFIELDTPDDKQDDISLTLEEVPINDVVQMFARLSGADIISPGTGVQARVTLSIRDRNWRDALDTILATADMVAVESEGRDGRAGILIVVPENRATEMEKRLQRAKPLVTRIIDTDYADPLDLIEQIKALGVLSSRGTIETTQGRKQHTTSLKLAERSRSQLNPSIITSILVKDIETKVEQVAELIKQIDVLEPQVFIEARILDVNRSKIEQVGLKWAISGTSGISWTPWGQTYGRNEDDSTVRSRSDERTRTDNGNNTRDLIGGAVSSAHTISDVANSSAAITRSLTDTLEKTLFEARSAVLGPFAASIMMDALLRDGTADEISHPLLVVGNGVEAKIHVGETRAIISIEEVPGEGGSQSTFTEEFTEVPTGLTLWVVPEISSDSSMVRLHLNPQIDVLVEEIQTSRGAVFPVVSSRELQTRVNVPSGHTVVIGGLKEVRVKKSRQKVPVLGDIPLLGKMFTHKDDEVVTKSLLLMITPTILDDNLPETGFERQAQDDVEFLEGETSSIYKGRDLREGAIPERLESERGPEAKDDGRSWNPLSWLRR